MLVTADIGNTNIVLAIFDGERFVTSFRVYTDTKKTSDEYFVIFNALFREGGVRPDMVDRAIISSVVPNLTRSVEKNLRRLFNIDPIVVTHDVESGLRRETIPSELGSDILCNLAYAHHRKPERAVMVLDFGTALTLSAVDSDGSVFGCSIAPGLVTAVNALFGNTAQLPQVELKIPSKAMGRDSQESIRAGIMFGYAGLADSIITRTEKEIGKDLYVIATGGLSQTISPLIGRIDEIDGIHTLRGLELISRLNS